MSDTGKQGYARLKEKLVFEKGSPGRQAWSLPPLDVADVDPAAELGELAREDDLAGIPELAEIDVVRHYTRLSRLNTAIELNTYPLGSCTMKYNPRVNETVSTFKGFTSAHPMAPAELSQGALAVMKTLERALSEITGMAGCTLQPSAGAQGELTGLMMIRAHHRANGDDQRTQVLIPDSAHGTNPASAAFCGLKTVEIKSGADGRVDLDELKSKLGPEVAGLMLTQPNTLGLFETHIRQITELVHQAGGLVYMDGANMNAMVGITQPARQGVDVLHLNLHKTFSTPHGGGGPGSGPVCVVEKLLPYLPKPTIEERDGEYRLEWDRPQSIGKVHGFYGNFGMHVRALAYILAHGPEGLERVGQVAVLNANYVRKGLEGAYHLPKKATNMHEVVFSDKLQAKHGVHTLDIAKRLMDYGFHPPTIYFPLIVSGAIMIEPTETESREDLDRFIGAMLAIAEEAEKDPQLLLDAPHTTPLRRLDEVRAARQPVLRWRPSEATEQG